MDINLVNETLDKSKRTKREYVPRKRANNGNLNVNVQTRKNNTANKETDAGEAGGLGGGTSGLGGRGDNSGGGGSY